MYKTIIVPVDLAHAEKGEAMIKTAKSLADKGARVILVNVVEEVPAYVSVEIPAGLHDKIVADTKETLLEMAAKHKLEADVNIIAGHPPTSIIGLSEDIDADLIVIASHRPGWQDYLLGSTAARVVRHAKCSVLVMR